MSASDATDKYCKPLEEGDVIERREYPWGEVSWWFWCPGCRYNHGFVVKKSPKYPGQSEWSFNGDPKKPTFSPSLRVFYQHPKTKKQVTKCHLFLRDGQLQFLGDCPHDMAGKTVPVEPPRKSRAKTQETQETPKTPKEDS